MLQTKFEGMFMFFLHTIVHLTSWNDGLINALK